MLNRLKQNKICKLEINEVQSVTKVYYVRHAEPNYNTDVNTLTVKILGIPIYELTKSGTEYIGKSIGVYMGAVCGICMAISVIAEELISKARHK